MLLLLSSALAADLVAGPTVVLASQGPGEVPLSGELRAADADGDGASDLYQLGLTGRVGEETEYASDVVRVYLGGPEGLASVAVSAHGGLEDAFLCDPDGDGVLDLVGRPDGERLAWYPQAPSSDAAMSAGWTATAFGGLCLGDLDGDGRDEVGVLSADLGSDVVAIYQGSSEGPGAAPRWRIDVGPTVQSAVYFAAGDVNGDGIADVGVQTSRDDDGWTYALSVLYGGPDGPVDGDLVVVSDPVVWPALLGAGRDVDGDGYADALFGTFVGEQPDRYGRALLLTGGPGGLGARAWSLAGDIPGGALAYRGALLGDVDGDGFGDLALSVCPDPAEPLASDIQLYRGSASGPLAAPAQVLRSDGRVLTGDVAGPGDVDGDGLADVGLASAASLEAAEAEDEGVALYAGVRALDAPSGDVWADASGMLTVGPLDVSVVNLAEEVSDTGDAKAGGCGCASGGGSAGAMETVLALLGLLGVRRSRRVDPTDWLCNRPVVGGG